MLEPPQSFFKLVNEKPIYTTNLSHHREIYLHYKDFQIDSDTSWKWFLYIATDKTNLWKTCICGHPSRLLLEKKIRWDIGLKNWLSILVIEPWPRLLLAKNRYLTRGIIYLIQSTLTPTPYFKFVELNQKHPKTLVKV